MNAQEEALVGLAARLDRLRVPYMIIGGIANAIWGEPRATLDIDATLWISEAEIAGTIRSLESELTILTANPVDFVAQTRVLPAQAANGVRIDLIFGMLPFEEAAVGRAIEIRIGDQLVRVCSPEDLILHKIVSDRERDVTDARGVALRQFARLDLKYLEPRITELAILLEKPEIELRWASWSEEARGIG